MDAAPFQYPRSDRAHCNSELRLQRMDAHGGFQYPRSDRAHCNPLALLGRQPDLPFQYPRSDRAHCNAHLAELLGHAALFQYPRSDRAHCNGQFGPHPPGSVRLSVSSVGSSPLQPPHWWRGTGILRRLSVSSVGSSPLQLVDEALTYAARISLSVSSVGSSPLQPAGGCAPRPVVSHFQYPRSDRAHCNQPASPPPAPPGIHSQSPRSDRAHCNILATRVMTAGITLSVSSVGSSPLQRDLP